MSYLLDVLGSYIVGALVILMIVGLNTNISKGSNEIVFSNIAQSNLSSIADVINHDFNKIGYRISSDAIAVADSNHLKFYADLDDNGNEDTLYYYGGLTSELSATPNSNDFLLYRILNNASPKSSMAVTKFQLTYYDSLGNQLSNSSLTVQTGRNSIRSIQVYIKQESTSPIDGVYQGAEWKKTITPRNL